MMGYFPQLESGALVQYPHRKQVQVRSIVNHCLDGAQIKFHDIGAQGIHWELRYAGLTTNERAALETFFHEMEGRLRQFTWLDPMSNLLASSEDFNAACWVRGPLLECTAGREDPLGGMAATRVVNSAQTGQSVGQTIAAPAVYTYTFSLWARAETEAEIVLEARAAGYSITAPRRISPVWSRPTHTVSLGAADDQVTFSVELAAGAAVELFGAQVEAQPDAGVYKKAGAASGVYPGSRFEQDELSFEADAPGSYATALRIYSAIQG